MIDAIQHMGQKMGDSRHLRTLLILGFVTTINLAHADVMSQKVSFRVKSELLAKPYNIKGSLSYDRSAWSARFIGVGTEVTFKLEAPMIKENESNVEILTESCKFAGTIMEKNSSSDGSTTTNVFPFESKSIGKCMGESMVVSGEVTTEASKEAQEEKIIVNFYFVPKDIKDIDEIESFGDLVRYTSIAMNRISISPGI